MSALGFNHLRKHEFVRKQDQVAQHLALLLRVPHGEDIAFVEAFAGFIFEEVEVLAARLHGKEHRREFKTCSRNIGLLAPARKFIEWPLRGNRDVDGLAHTTCKMVTECAVPFWENYSTLEKLAGHYDEGDPSVCCGEEWPWRYAAVCILLGLNDRAAGVIEQAGSRQARRPTDTVSPPKRPIEIGDGSCTTIRYESESGRSVENPNDFALREFLGELDGHENSYAALTMPDGSYVQVGGGMDGFVVEVREIRQGDEFRHLRAAFREAPDGNRQVVIGRSLVTVASSEVLDLSAVHQIFRVFLRDRVPDRSFAWHDVTAMFVQSSGPL